MQTITKICCNIQYVIQACLGALNAQGKAFEWHRTSLCRLILMTRGHSLWSNVQEFEYQGEFLYTVSLIERITFFWQLAFSINFGTPVQTVKHSSANSTWRVNTEFCSPYSYKRSMHLTLPRLQNPLGKKTSYQPGIQNKHTQSQTKSFQISRL